MRKGFLLLLLAAAACNPATAADAPTHKFGRADDINLRGAKCYDANGPLQLGTAATSSHSLATGDVLVGGKQEVNGAFFADGNSTFAGPAAFSSTVVTPIGTVNEATLAIVAAADLNVTTKSTLYTCPTGKTCVITKIIEGPTSGTVATADCAFGWNASANDVVATAVRGATTTTYFELFPILTSAGAKLGAAADVFGIKCGTAEGSAKTARIHVVGYYY